MTNSDRMFLIAGGGLFVVILLVMVIVSIESYERRQQKGSFINDCIKTTGKIAECRQAFEG